MTRFIHFILFLALALPSMAVSKVDADKAYQNANYKQAAALYEQLLREGENADVYYNLGNCYYRRSDYTRAIINYERALLLSPGDGDISYNLEMARAHTVDKIVPAREMFFFSWYCSLTHLMSADGWGMVALFSFIVVLVGLLLYFFVSRIVVRKIGFFSSLVFFFLFIFSNIFAYQLKSELENRDGAIVIASSVSVRSTPNNSGTELFVIHSGTKIKVLDSLSEWLEVQLEDGKTGWLQKKKVEII